MWSNNQIVLHLEKAAANPPLSTFTGAVTLWYDLIREQILDSPFEWCSQNTIATKSSQYLVRI